MYTYYNDLKREKKHAHLTTNKTIISIRLIGGVMNEFRT